MGSRSKLKTFIPATEPPGPQKGCRRVSEGFLKGSLKGSLKGFEKGFRRVLEGF